MSADEPLNPRILSNPCDEPIDNNEAGAITTIATITETETVPLNEEEKEEKDETELEHMIDESMTTLLKEIEDASPKTLTSRQIVNIYIVYFSVFLDNMGVSIVQPILPFYADSFEANSFQLGMLYSSYSLMATFATIFMAKMSDRFGRRPMIIFSLFGTMSGFLLTGFAWNYESLLAFRFYTGAFGGSFSVAQAYMTDICPKDVLEKYLAGIGGIMAVAFIIGPLLGGLLSQYGLPVPFFASAAAGAVGFVVALIWLQESYFPEKIKEKHEKQERLKELKAQKDANNMDIEDVPLKEIKSTNDDIDDADKVKIKKGGACDNCRKIPVQVWMILVSYFLASIGWCTFTAMFAQYMIDEYGLNTGQVSIITVIIGTVYVIANVVIFTYMAKVIGIYWLAFCGLILFAISLGLAPLSDEIWGILVFMCIGVGIGNGVLMPCMSAMGADFADDDNRGSVLGWITVGNQSAFVVGPLIMGALYAVEPDYIFYVGAGFVAAGFIPVAMLLIIWPETRKPKKYDKHKDSPEIEEYLDHPETWKYTADKPSYSDYHKFGKDFGKMLIERGYQWKTYYPRFVEVLDLTFPPIRTDKFENYYSDCRVVRKNLEKVKWEFDHIKELQQVSLMGEASHVIYGKNKND